jgi:2-polyprenyl-6-methoxyphenol hydroxylase-like FAD-dependent oxidoreductase
VNTKPDQLRPEDANMVTSLETVPVTPISLHSPILPEQTDCCVVGGGPAGAVLALSLARKGIRVTLLEAKSDFDREFRGDTLHPAVMEALDALGLAEAVLALPHARVERFVVRAGPDEAVFAEFSGLQTRFPYIVMVPQSSLLELLVKEASRYPNFRLLMNARVEALLEDDGPETMQVNTVLGVRYRSPNGIGVIRADLTVGADGRFSVLRRLAKLEANLTTGAGSAMVVLWFRLPSEPGDPPGTGATFRFGRGGLLVLMRHAEGWQAGLILEKGGYANLKAAGLACLRATVAALAPEFAARSEALRAWKQTSLLSVVSGCLPRWSRPGLLLIGDAAHPASPVGGVGINLAVQDALEAARRLAGPLQQGMLEESDLLAVERARRGPTRLVQMCQEFAQRWVVARALGPGVANAGPIRLPWWLRTALSVPKLRRIPGGLIAFAARPKSQVPRISNLETALEAQVNAVQIQANP